MEKQTLINSQFQKSRWTSSSNKFSRLRPVNRQHKEKKRNIVREISKTQSNYFRKKKEHADISSAKSIPNATNKLFLFLIKTVHCIIM